MSQFLITILAEVARMERKTIRERVASGYQNFRSNGGKVGRKVGYSKSNEKVFNIQFISIIIIYLIFMIRIPLIINFIRAIL